MKIEDAVKKLEDYQEWRLGGDIEPLHPTTITDAINTTLKFIKDALQNESELLSK